MGEAVMALMLLTTPVSAQDGAEALLGIPTAAPWLNTSEKTDTKTAVEEARPPHPLDVRFRTRVKSDLESIELWREGLLESLRFARTQPQIFPAQAKSRPEALYQEYRDIALSVWVRSMDYWLALETLVDRYGDFHVLEGADQRRRAFLVLYAAYLTQARFAQEWTRLADRDPALAALFNEPVPALGLKEGAYSNLRDRGESPQARQDLKTIRSYYARIGGAKALKEFSAISADGWSRRRMEDLARLSAPKRLNPLPAEGAFGALKRRPPGGEKDIVSLAGSFGVADGVRKSTHTRLLLPQPKWAEATFSTRAAYAIDTFRYWFQMDPATGTRPHVLIWDEQALRFAQELEPGDILLVRRENFIGEIGLAGYWHEAGVYVGTPEQRRRFFKSDKPAGERVRALYEKAAPETVVSEKESKTERWKGKAGDFLKDLNPWRAQASSAAAAVEHDAGPAPEKPEAPAVFHVGPKGVAMETMTLFAAADAVAALRPRLSKRARSEALIRCFELLGKTYDYRHDFRSDAAVSGAELVDRAYRAGRKEDGLSFPWSESAGRWSMSANAIARKFDAEFGTSGRQLDWVLFSDAIEHKQASESSTLEEFRRSWRRPKWTFQKEN